MEPHPAARAELKLTKDWAPTRCLEALAYIARSSYPGIATVTDADTDVISKASKVRRLGRPNAMAADVCLSGTMAGPSSQHRSHGTPGSRDAKIGIALRKKTFGRTFDH